MGGIWMVAGHDLRRRWVATVAIALLIGVVGAVVMAAAAGARRSGTAVARFNAFSRSSDLEVDLGVPTDAQVRAFVRAAGGDAALIRAYAISPDGRPNLAIGAPTDNTLGTLVDRPRIIAGRLADPNAPDEITIGEALSAQQHLPVGSYLDAASLSPAQLAAINGSGDPTVDVRNPQGPRLHLHVVGITRRPFDLSDRSASGGVVLLTPAFNRKYADRIGLFTDVVRVHTGEGAVGRDRVLALARKAFGASPFFSSSDSYSENRGPGAAVGVLTVALWLIAAITAVAGMVAIAIVLSRDIAQIGPEQAAFAAIGLTRRDRIAAVGPRAIAVAVGGAFVAAVGAVALSPLFPFGIARRADPDAGLHADWVVLGLGVLGVVVLVGLVAFLSAVRATRDALDPLHPSRSMRTLAQLLAGSGLRPTAVAGVQMAADRGRDERALPARSAFVGAIVGVLGVTAAIVFAASLSHLVATPHLFGWTWDFKAPDNSFTTPCNRTDFGLDRKAGVSDIAAVCYQDVDVDGRAMIGWGFQPVRGRIDPEIVAGRAPRAPDEVALGSVTLDALGKKIGDAVRVSNGVETHHYRVVGKVLLPQIKDGDVQPLADGAAFTEAGIARVPKDSPTRYIIGRYAAGADRAKVQRSIASIPQFGAQGGFLTDHVGGPALPPEIDRLRNIDWLPPMLAGLTAALALIAVANALVSAVRRRRREFAVLKAIGFDRGQVRATVAYHASVLALVGLVIGVPLGVLVGRVAWSIVADNIGIGANAVLPVLALALLIPATLLLVNLIAFGPAHAAARTRPAVALAAE